MSCLLSAITITGVLIYQDSERNVSPLQFFFVPLGLQSRC